MTVSAVQVQLPPDSVPDVVMDWAPASKPTATHVVAVGQLTP